MAKGKNIFVAIRSSFSGKILATRSINKAKKKPADIAYPRYCPDAQKRVPVTVKEIKKSN